MSDSLWPHGLQHAWLPCPSPAPGTCSNPCPLSRWRHPTISSSVVPFSTGPQIFPSIKVFSNESALCIRWPKYWSFSVTPSNEHPGLISFRMDWLDLLAVQGTLKSLLQHHSSKASILWHLALLVVMVFFKTGANSLAQVKKLKKDVIFRSSGVKAEWRPWSQMYLDFNIVSTPVCVGELVYHSGFSYCISKMCIGTPTLLHNTNRILHVKT